MVEEGGVVAVVWSDAKMGDGSVDVFFGGGVG
jgi:hypothetical protein